MRKYLLFLLFISLAFVSKAQIHVTRTDGKITPVDIRAAFRKSVKIPVFPDTTTATTWIGVDSLGCMFWNRTNSTLYARDTSVGTHKWTAIAGGGGGGGITALTTDVSASGTGSVPATIQPNVVSNSKLAQMGANTIKGNNTGSTANAADLTPANVAAMLNSLISIGISQVSGLSPAIAAKITNAGGVPSIQSGLYSARPSATGSGAIYISTDSARIDYDFAIGNWVKLGGGSGGSSLSYPNIAKKYLGGYGSFNTLNSDSVNEGSANLFFTNGRARNAISAQAPITYNPATGVVGADTTPGRPHLVSQAMLLDSITAIKAIQRGYIVDSITINPTKSFFSGDSIVVAGHSIAWGTGFAATNVDSTWAKRVCNYFHKPMANYSIIGCGITSVVYQLGTHDLPTNHRASLAMGGINNLRYTPGNMVTRRMYVNAYAAAFINHLSTGNVPATGGGVTRVGTGWSSIAQIDGALSTNIAYTNVSGDYIEFSFTDSAAGIVLMGCDSSSTNYYGTIAQISVDGSPTQTIRTSAAADGVADFVTPSQFTGHRSPLAVFVTGLGYGPHTIRVTNTQNKYLYVDYFAVLLPQRLAQPFLIMHEPYVGGNVTTGGVRRNGWIDSCSAAIDSMQASLKQYPLLVGRTEQYYSGTGTQVISDSLHPTDFGHRLIGQAALANTDSVHLEGRLIVTNGALYLNINQRSEKIYSNKNLVGSNGIELSDTTVKLDPKVITEMIGTNPNGTDRRIGIFNTAPTYVFDISAPATSVSSLFRLNSASTSTSALMAFGALNTVYANIGTGPNVTNWTAQSYNDLGLSSTNDLNLFGNRNLNYKVFNGDFRWQTTSTILNTMKLNGHMLFNTTTDSSASVHIGAGSSSVAPLKFTAGAVLTTPVNGTVEFDGAHYYGTAGGTRYQLDQQSSGGSPYAYVGTADASTITNTTTPASITASGAGSLTIAANTFAAGKVMKIHIDGIVSTDATNPQFTIGGTVLGTAMSFGSFSQASLTNAPYSIDLTFVCRGSGASAVMSVFEQANVNGTAYTFAPLSITFNTTTSNTVSSNGYWTTASTNNSLTNRNFLLEIK